jgi:hypothetical protein
MITTNTLSYLTPRIDFALKFLIVKDKAGSTGCLLLLRLGLLKIGDWR